MFHKVDTRMTVHSSMRELRAEHRAELLILWAKLEAD
jgi:hypothetical protein